MKSVILTICNKDKIVNLEKPQNTLQIIESTIAKKVVSVFAKFNPTLFNDDTKR
jgi:hypothetical protein